MTIPRQLWLSAAFDDETHELLEHDRFGINERHLMMPSYIVAGGLTLGEAHDRLPSLKAGAVALGYGNFWIFWETNDCLGPAETDDDYSETAYEKAIADGLIIDMHGGLLCLDEKGEWKLLGAS